MSEVSEKQKAITSDMITAEVKTYLKSINLNFITRTSDKTIGKNYYPKIFVYFKTETLNVIADCYMELSGYYEYLDKPPYITLVHEISTRSRHWELDDIKTLQAVLRDEILPLKKNLELEALERLIKIVESFMESKKNSELEALKKLTEIVEKITDKMEPKGA